MKREVQVKESKSLIVDAFLSLLKKKSYDDITLAEIAEYAGVSRMTLHRHFKNKENIIIYQAKNIFATMNNNILNTGIHNLEEDICNRFRILKNLPHVKLLIRGGKLPNIIYNTIDPLRMELRSSFVDKYYKVKPDLYIQQFVTGGVKSMLEEWIKNDFDQTPQEMTKKVMQILKILQNYIVSPQILQC